MVMLPECRRSGQSHGQIAAQTVLTGPSTATSRQPPDPAPPCDFDAPYPEAGRYSPYLSPKEVPKVFPKCGHHRGHRVFGPRPAAVANHCSSAGPTVGRVGPR
ncbi:hypothetical protein ACIG0C_05755 [Kitasatospora aureofaciens]|uniref:Uncharacterized protein n=1 Tax=Kitasatospora aureofaciens TaxID=1894 RepID=A0A1E7N7T8_KITAU|nr:hypothetical protein [Kitasatospora aureofaciens]OEV36738.1 hypothetical protein HS99_0027325 [Kitasatospora aureofaciens]GGU69730.1 hypothetical protein GCM10010502_21230 [Kitasatospora aureofaciens]